MKTIYEIAVGAGGLIGLTVGIIQLYLWFAEPIKNWFRLRKKRRKARKYIRLRERIDQLERNREVEAILLEAIGKLFANVAIIGFGLMSVNIHVNFDLPSRSWIPDLMTWPLDASDPSVYSIFLGLGVLIIFLATTNLILESLKMLKNHTLLEICLSLNLKLGGWKMSYRKKIWIRFSTIQK